MLSFLFVNVMLIIGIGAIDTDVTNNIDQSEDRYSANNIDQSEDMDGAISFGQAEDRKERTLIGTFPDSAHHGEHHHDHHNDHSHEKDNLLNRFPFKQVDRGVVADVVLENSKKENEDLENEEDTNNEHINIIETLENLEENAEGRKCVDKVMMVEETEYDEILTCDHSYDTRCHTSYVTKYEPHQEEECEEQFRKECLIDYEKKAVEEIVQFCVTPIVKDCELDGEETCQKVYQSECSTRQIVHQVEDDVAKCETIQEEKCEEISVGYTTKLKCDTWPKEKCVLEKKEVKKYTPETVCDKVPRVLCAPKACGLKEGPVECRDKKTTVIIDNPVEECDMEPVRTCRHVTKLVPRLVPTQECVDVPKEVCARSKVNPRKVKKPAVQRWCFKPNDVVVESESNLVTNNKF